MSLNCRPPTSRAVGGYPLVGGDPICPRPPNFCSGQEKQMDINRFTQKAQESLQAAHERAARTGHQQVDVEHLLMALLEQEPGLALSILRKADISVEGLKRQVERELEKLPRVTGVEGSPDQVYLTGRLNRLATQAEKEAKHFKDDFISVEHLLLA